MYNTLLLHAFVAVNNSSLHKAVHVEITSPLYK
jgi:hypothetical protein